MQNISLRSSGMRRKQNFEIVFGFKSDKAVLTFTFRFFSSLVFQKAFRILGLGERKGRWAMEQDFHGDFQVNVTWFFASFSGVLD